MAHWRRLDTVSEAERALAFDREMVIRPLAAEAIIPKEAIAEAMTLLGVSRTLLYRLIARYRRRPEPSTLLPLTRGRARLSRHLGKAREDLLEKLIREDYLRPERPSLAALHRLVRARFHEATLAPPSYAAIRRRVEGIDEEVRVRRREGVRAARQLGRVRASSLQPDTPLAVLQIDHTRVDLQLVDEREREVIGRPFLTLAVDIATRVIAGFHVSLEPPSAVSVSMALTHAVLPKAPWLADRELSHLDWPVCGIPATIHVDNAKEFHSQALALGCEKHGIRLQHRPRLTPHFGGHVERLIGTMMGAVHLLPGTTFSNVQERGEYDSEGRSALSLTGFERWLALEIAGGYHLRVHSSLGTAPLQAWHEATSARRAAIRPPPHDATEFFLDFLPFVPRKVERDGIHFHRIRYWSSVLSPWAGRRKEPLLVKYNPRDLSRVYVLDPSGERHWPIPYLDLGKPPISLWELDAARRRLKAGASFEQNEQRLFETILQQRRIVEDSVRSTQDRRNRERAPTAPLSPDPSDQPDRVAAQDLKPFPVEIVRKR